MPWYVSVIDAGRTGLVLGPFDIEEDCRHWAYDTPDHWRLVKATIEATQGRACFYKWGMVKVSENISIEGKMNKIFPNFLTKRLDSVQET